MMKTDNLQTIALATDADHLDYRSARGLADTRAEALLASPLLVAWYDGIRNEEHPDVPECQHKPGWIAYAEGHGGCLRINVNGQTYCFIYADADATN